MHLAKEGRAKHMLSDRCPLFRFHDLYLFMLLWWKDWLLRCVGGDIFPIVFLSWTFLSLFSPAATGLDEARIPGGFIISFWCCWDRSVVALGYVRPKTRCQLYAFPLDVMSCFYLLLLKHGLPFMTGREMCLFSMTFLACTFYGGWLLRGLSTMVWLGPFLLQLRVCCCWLWGVGSLSFFS